MFGEQICYVDFIRFIVWLSVPVGVKPAAAGCCIALRHDPRGVRYKLVDLTGLCSFISIVVSHGS